MDSWTRVFKSVYRKEPVISFMVTAGVMNVAIGGLSEHWSLMTVGLGAVGVAITLRLRQMQARRPIEPPHRPPVYILPPSSPGLPSLSISKKNSPDR